MTSPSTSVEWQELLDKNFPEGALVSEVLPDGLLSRMVYRVPVLVVMAMHGTEPLIVGIGSDGKDIQLRVSSWEEIDRDGHYIARAGVTAADGPGGSTYEVSSWLSPVLAAALAPVREAQRDWLMQVAESADEAPAEVEPIEASPEDAARVDS